MTARVVVVATLWTALAVGCWHAPTEVVPLLDGRHRPDVLTERGPLAPPTSWTGNRFVVGWRYERSGGALRILPTAPVGRLELVQLAARDRVLVLRSTAGSGTVRLTAAGRPLGRYQVSPVVEVRLPADLPLGRVPVEVELSEPQRVELAGARIRPVLPQGTVELASDDVVQSGWSAVDVVRSVAAGSRISGSFVAPRGPSLDQRFAVLLDRGDGVLHTLFEWPTESSDPAPELFEFAAVLRRDDGLVRVRLVAEGQGPPGTWRDLAVTADSPQVAEQSVSAPALPRLVVLYVMDALRADALGAHGSSRGASPTLDRLAAEGVVFGRHFSVAPNTPTSTKTLFTGQVFMAGGGLPADGPATLAELFRAAGCRTAAVSSNPYLSADQGLVRGFDHVEFLKFQEDFRSGAAPTPNDSADRVHRAALAWLDRLDPHSRGLLYLHTLHPHNPYTPPEPFPDWFAPGGESAIDGGTKTLVGIRDGAIEPSAADQARLRDLYLANLAYNDHLLADLIGQIARRYGSGEVLLVVTSDHGEELFDHGGVLHGYTLYDEMVHVPLILWWPGRLAPRRVDALTDTLDLHVTLREMVDPAAGSWVDAGESLWGAMTGEDRRRRIVRFATTAGNRRVSMARSDDWKLILAPNQGLEWGMGLGRGASSDPEYAFRIDVDPGERVNLAGSESLELAWLRSRLLAWSAHWSGRQPDAPPAEVDEETRRQLRALGYTE